MARAALATLEAAGDDWGVAAAALIRAATAAPGGDVATVAEMAAMARRRADAIGYDAFRVPALLLEAWVSERRQDAGGAAEAYRAAAELADASGSTTTPRSPSRARRRSRSPAVSCARPEELARRHSRRPRPQERSWPAALARVQLARCAAAAGDAETAEQLYREVTRVVGGAAAASGAVRACSSRSPAAR